MNQKPVSKILVLDKSSVHNRTIKEFCDANGLVPLKARKSTVMAVLRTNIDLGGILYSDDFGDTPEETVQLALDIHAARPELPIFMRCDSQSSQTGLENKLDQIICATYLADGMEKLRDAINRYIFCVMYPNALLRGISEITTSVLTNQFQNLTVTVDTPYIVRDRVIFGELFSLIPLESAWCRGFMMLQAEATPLMAMANGRSAIPAQPTFREVNDLLGEITNLIWGAFKNRYIGDNQASLSRVVQVPIIVNHNHRYISFGSENPQLCFHLRLTDQVTGSCFSIYERFIFNLSWSPDDFMEIPQEVNQLIASGELELF